MSNLPAIPQEVLLVEDEKLARDALSRILKGRGYSVLQADSGRSAILQAKESSVTVVLMDIRLGDEIDGVEAAQEIQHIHPLTSFIFISAYARNPAYHERALKSRLRIGGWVEKPFDVSDLVQLIEKERTKLRVLLSIKESRERGLNPLEYLQSIESTLPPQIVKELRDELQGPQKQQGGGGDDAALDRTAVRPRK
jgi:CheY-like chemotaxis protein